MIQKRHCFILNRLFKIIGQEMQFMTTDLLPNCILKLTELQNTIPFMTEMNNDIDIIKKFIENFGRVKKRKIHRFTTKK